MGGGVGDPLALHPASPPSPAPEPCPRAPPPYQGTTISLEFERTVRERGELRTRAFEVGRK